MKTFVFVALFAAAQSAPAPGLLGGSLALQAAPYAIQAAPIAIQSAPIAIKSAPLVSSTLVTGGSVPLAVGGYKAKAGVNTAGLAGPIHKVPGALPAPALITQQAPGGVSLTTGTNAATIVSAGWKKRSAEAEPEAEAEAEADPGLLLGSPLVSSIAAAPLVSSISSPLIGSLAAPALKTVVAAPAVSTIVSAPISRTVVSSGLASPGLLSPGVISSGYGGLW